MTQQAKFMPFWYQEPETVALRIDELITCLKDMIAAYESDDGRGPIAVIERSKAAIAQAEGK